MKGYSQCHTVMPEVNYCEKLFPGRSCHYSFILFCLLLCHEISDLVLGFSGNLAWASLGRGKCPCTDGQIPPCWNGEMLTLHCTDVCVTQLSPKVAACDFLRGLLELFFFEENNGNAVPKLLANRNMFSFLPLLSLKTKPGSGFPPSMVCQVLKVSSNGASNIKTVGASPGEGTMLIRGLEHLP